MGDVLNGRSAPDTGASRRIGRTIAVALAYAGADVSVNYQQNEYSALELACNGYITGQPINVNGGRYFC